MYIKQLTECDGTTTSKHATTENVTIMGKIDTDWNLQPHLPGAWLINAARNRLI